MTTGVDGGVAALRVDGVTFSYGSAPTISDVSFEVGGTEAVALLGTNGAGKSTLLRLVAGLERPAGGRVLLFGEDVTAMKAEQRCRQGVVLVRGGRGVFADLTVAENLAMYGRLRAGRGEFEEGRDRALSLFPVLAARLRQPARSLSGGERQQLALAKAVVAAPRLLCIDELSRGLAPAAIDELMIHVGALNAEGVPVLLVEQNLVLAASVCRRAVFLEKGAVRFDGLARKLLRRPDLARAVFFGGEARA
ncbi:MAG TPA: ATP-binding cassette domain-containing protein [Acidimicrobiales bacterium]|nr:ATP-binding cassette domain-containing protein [Acidimicrobiales bacterium]